MSYLKKIWNTLRSRRLHDEMQEEMRTHLAMLEDEGRAEGRSEKEAHLAARRRFGNESAYREKTRDEEVAGWLDGLGQDLRFAVRALKKSPGFTINAVLLLALGIGLNTAIFTIINSAVLRALPLPDPERLVVIMEGSKTSGFQGRSRGWAKRIFGNRTMFFKQQGPSDWSRVCCFVWATVNTC